MVVRHGRLSTFPHYSAAVPEHTARRWEWAIVCGARCLCFALLSLHKPSVPESPEFNLLRQLLRQFLKKGSDKGQVRFLSYIYRESPWGVSRISRWAGCGPASLKTGEGRKGGRVARADILSHRHSLQYTNRTT